MQSFTKGNYLYNDQNLIKAKYGVILSINYIDNKTADNIAKYSIVLTWINLNSGSIN